MLDQDIPIIVSYTNTHKFDTLSSPITFCNEILAVCHLVMSLSQDTDIPMPEESVSDCCVTLLGRTYLDLNSEFRTFF